MDEQVVKDRQGVKAKAMRRALPALAGLLLLFGTGASARAAEPDPEGASQFQQSYDREIAGRLSEALGALDGLSPARKESYPAQARRGWLLFKLGRHGESAEAYQRAITAAPKAIEPRVGILLPLQALKKWSEVESQAKAALALDADNYLASLRLAWALYNQSRYAEAASLYARLRELYPSDADARSGLGWSLLKQGNNEAAARELRELLAIQPRNTLARQGLDAAKH
jgi:tetratricopeptide (TPR) repeat protein